MTVFEISVTVFFFLSKEKVPKICSHFLLVIFTVHHWSGPSLDPVWTNPGLQNPRPQHSDSYKVIALVKKWQWTVIQSHRFLYVSWNMLKVLCLCSSIRRTNMTCKYVNTWRRWCAHRARERCLVLTATGSNDRTVKPHTYFICKKYKTYSLSKSLNPNIQDAM